MRGGEIEEERKRERGGEEERGPADLRTTRDD